jgi:hypothetical protein
MKTKKMKLRVAQQTMLGYLRRGLPHDWDPDPRTMRQYNLGWLAQTTNSLVRKGLIVRDDLNGYTLTERGLAVSKQNWPDFVVKYVNFNAREVLTLGKVLGETPNGEDWIVSFSTGGVDYKGMWRKQSCEV